MHPKPSIYPLPFYPPFTFLPILYHPIHPIPSYLPYAFMYTLYIPFLPTPSFTSYTFLSTRYIRFHLIPSYLSYTFLYILYFPMHPKPPYISYPDTFLSILYQNWLLKTYPLKLTFLSPCKSLSILLLIRQKNFEIFIHLLNFIIYYLLFCLLPGQKTTSHSWKKDI